jgi:hypothetical protein
MSKQRISSGAPGRCEVRVDIPSYQFRDADPITEGGLTAWHRGRGALI